jgi:hypothetical protein
MTIIIKPTIGRRVWYWPSELEYAEAERLTKGEEGVLGAQDRSQPCDAGICYVHDERRVNLTVADHAGLLHARRYVPLVQEGDAPPPPGTAYAQWMPYQTGQAAKQAQPAANDFARCTKKLQAAGAAYPRTCAECGLGPCRA